MTFSLVKYQVGSFLCRQNVFSQIFAVNLSPNRFRRFHRFLLRQLRKALEIRPRVGKCPLSEFHKTGNIPIFEQLLFGIYINRKVDKVGYKYPWLFAGVIHSALQYVKTLQNQDVGLLNNIIFVRDNIVYQVRISGHFYPIFS